MPFWKNGPLSGKKNRFKMFQKILVANRGEIACRIFKTARRMGIQTVGIVAPQEKSRLFLRDADQIAPLNESYLDI